MARDFVHIGGRQEERKQEGNQEERGKNEKEIKRHVI